MRCGKHFDRRGCCRSKSDAESSPRAGAAVVRSPTDLKPHYYFGVTIDDLRRVDGAAAAASNSPDNVTDDSTTYDRITTPPPDVVPHLKVCV